MKNPVDSNVVFLLAGSVKAMERQRHSLRRLSLPDDGESCSIFLESGRTASLMDAA